jgi:hypothetical protein
MTDNESELEYQGRIIERGKMKSCPSCGSSKWIESPGAITAKPAAKV